MKVHKYMQESGQVFELEILGDEYYVRILSRDGAELGEVMLDKADAEDLKGVISDSLYKRK